MYMYKYTNIVVFKKGQFFFFWLGRGAGSVQQKETPGDFF